MRPQYSLAELLPHRKPMMLIDEVDDFDATNRSLTASVTIREEWKGNVVAIEYMAQTAAALVGCFDRECNDVRPARPGFLLGTRKLTLKVPEFEVGARYTIHCVNEFTDLSVASFECEMFDSAGVSVAKARLNAFRPEDPVAFAQNGRK